MNTEDIYNLLSKSNVTAPYFAGVYASDRLPYRLFWPFCIVVNTDPITKPGSHWIAIFVDKYGNGEIFDSYGKPPTVKSIINFIHRNTKKSIYNNQRLQSFDSIICGHYCCVYLYYKCSNLSLFKFVSDHLAGDYYETDFKLYKSFVNLFPGYVKSKKSNCQCCCAEIHSAYFL